MVLVHQGSDQRLVAASLESIQRVRHDEGMISRRGSVDPELSLEPIGLAKVDKFGIARSRR